MATELLVQVKTIQRGVFHPSTCNNSVLFDTLFDTHKMQQRKSLKEKHTFSTCAIFLKLNLEGILLCPDASPFPHQLAVRHH